MQGIPRSCGRKGAPARLVRRRGGASLRIEKSQIPTLIYTSTHRIEGTYFKLPDARLLDDLNARKDFIPLSQVRVSSLQNENEILFESDLVIVNKHQIALLVFDPTMK